MQNLFVFEESEDLCAARLCRHLKNRARSVEKSRAFEVKESRKIKKRFFRFSQDDKAVKLANLYRLDGTCTTLVF